MKNNLCRIFIFSLFLIFISAAFVSAQDLREQEKIKKIEESYRLNIPVWLLYEYGRQAYELGEYGLASRVFREAIDRAGIAPEAEIWLARIFENEGEYNLAEKQYLKALEYKNDLYVIEEEIDLLYSLAEIYRKTDQYGKYEKTLISVIENDSEIRINMNLQYSMIDVLKKRGIDKMFELYRYEKTKYNSARTGLGIFYYRTGRYSEAEINLILPLVSVATTGFNYIYDKTANYEFTNILSHIKRMLEYPELSQFLETYEFFQTLYYLAASLYADGFYDSASEIWMIITECDKDDSTWTKRSERQLEDPFIEPVIRQR